MVLAWALTVSSAGAYYHFIHYTSNSASYGPVPEKFDLAALPNKTITFFVSNSGPTSYSPNDSFPSVLSQIRQATRAWDAVATSDLRITFGGLYADGTPENTAGGEVVFDQDIPPGVLAFSTHTTATSMITRPDGSFFPITRSLIHLNSDLTQRPGPSYTDSFYLTVVHEMGHALGLQHTFTSSVMATSVTRATSALHPLDADDMAAISLLYPRNLGATGSITGTVTSGQAGVHLASVVALRPNGSAVSALTNPDGSYRIDGVPPGTYFVYVHPLPPSADITLPLDSNGNPVQPSGPFNAEFYPGVSDYKKATPLAVTAGGEADGINFSVSGRSSVPVYDVSTYSYFGQNPVHPAYVNLVPGSATIAAAGTGLGANGQVTPGLGLSILGSAFIRPGGLRGYGSTPTYLAIDLGFTLGASTGPQHFIFSENGALYVLPGALNLVSIDPPSIASVATDSSGNVTVTGSNFTPTSQVYFDGFPAVTNIIDNSHAAVIPPPGASNQTSTVTMYTTDGQSSMFLGPQPPPTYKYPAAPAPKVLFAPSVLPAGTRAMIDITGVNTDFVDGLMTVGFGSSDVLVRQVWVLSPTHALANVQIAPNAQLGASMASVISGFQIFSQPSEFQVLVANPKAPIVEPTLINGVWLPTGIYPGAIASLFGVNLGGAQTKMTIGDQPVSILYASPTQINLVIPASLKPGPAILKLNNGTDNAYPVVVSIGAAPPVITAVQSAAKTSVDLAHAANPGDTLTLLVAGLANSGSTVDPKLVQVAVGGMNLPVSTVSAASDTSFVVQFTLNSAVPSGAKIPVTISINGTTSLPVYIAINAPAGSSTGQ